MYRSVNNTGLFLLIPWMICIPFLALDITFTLIGVGFWQSVLSSHFPALNITVIICSSRFFIRIFYNTFINSFLSLHVLNILTSLFKWIYPQSKICTYAFLIHPFGIMFKIISFNTISPILSLSFDPGNAAKYSLILIIMTS